MLAKRNLRTKIYRNGRGPRGKIERDASYTYNGGRGNSGNFVVGFVQNQNHSDKENDLLRPPVFRIARIQFPFSVMRSHRGRKRDKYHANSITGTLPS